MLRIEPGEDTILQQLRRAGVLPESPCNGKGLCGKCKVRIVSGPVSPLTGQEEKLLTAEEIARGVRLACLTAPLGPVEVDPMGLLEERRGNILGDGEMPSIAFSPAVTAERLRPDREAMKNGASLCRAFGGALEAAPLAVLRRLPSLLEEPELQAVRYEGALAELRQEGELFGLAVDIGTTTVAVSLIDLATGERRGEDGFVNPQKAFGLDVLSRIHYDLEHPGGAEELRETIVRRLSESAAQLTRAAGSGPEAVYEVVAAGNSTMLHALLGVPLGSLGRAPYNSVFAQPVTVLARQLGLETHPEARVYCVPAVSTYIGGDIVAGALAARLDEAEDTVLFIDIGTNGEMILSQRGRMYACSCAAGPALEGMNISCGMRAEPGAIEHVSIEGARAVLGVIGGESPRGLCGSGILETVSQAVRHGVIARTGRICAEHPLTDTDARGKRRIVLDRDHGVYVTQEDVRQVQLCKGAILSGVLTLLERLELAPGDIDRVLVAGQFGRHLDPESLTGAELIPAALKERIAYIGNSSQTGARMCLLSREERRRAERIAEEISYIELSVSPGYEKRFTKSLQFGGA